jgi:hypothetical protein
MNNYQIIIRMRIRIHERKAKEKGKKGEKKYAQRKPEEEGNGGKGTERGVLIRGSVEGDEDDDDGKGPGEKRKGVESSVKGAENVSGGMEKENR